MSQVRVERAGQHVTAGVNEYLDLVDWLREVFMEHASAASATCKASMP